MAAVVRQRPSLWRLGAAGFISLLGIVLLVPTADYLLVSRGTTPGLVVAGTGAVVATVLVIAGYLLYREEFTASHLLRIAGWATLGTILLGLVITLIVLAGVPLPLYAGATLLSVSTFAHVLIGVRDVQRIRAEELARQREQLAVLNRLVRHNLRHVAQRLLGLGSRLPNADAAAIRTEIGTDIESIASDLTDMNEMLDRSRAVINRDRDESTTVNITDMVEGVVSEYRETYPDATIETDIDRSYHVRGGGELREAIAELVENGIVHAETTPHVTVTAQEEGNRVIVEITDRGPGVPEREREVIMREAEIDQLTHSQGLGLWFVRWVMDAYDGDIEIQSSQSNGSTISLSLPQT